MATDDLEDVSAASIRDIGGLRVEKLSIDEDEIEGDVASGSDPLSCENVGGIAQTFNVTNVFRGNMFRVNSPGTLQSFAFTLTLNGSSDLYFSILRRPQTGGAFHRARPDILLRAVGAGRQEFSTALVIPQLNFQVFPGFDYLLAVAWGETSIGAPRDVATYPLAFSHGTTQGSLQINLLAYQGSGPPINIDPAFGLDIAPFTGAAAAMRLCFEPEAGACCCVGEVGCDLLTPAMCKTAGGYFRGERTTCLTQACQCGACCLPCRGECRNDVDGAACLSTVKGDFKGEGTECADVEACPVRTGACCLFGDCVELCEAECALLSPMAAFKGVGTSCDVNPCQGACCFDGTGGANPVPGFCFDATTGDCGSLHGSFAGNATACATLTSINECGGACCFGANPNTRTCSADVTRATCAAAPNSRYLGDGTPCPSNCNNLPSASWDFGACCLSAGMCLVTTSEYCNESWVNGVFQGSGTTCTAMIRNTCMTLPDFACCMPDGSCRLESKPDCSAVGGVHVSGSASCNAGTCPAPRGACCLGTVCNQGAGSLTRVQCEGMSGTYLGDGSTCSGNLACPAVAGACCFSDGRDCDQLTTGQCSLAGGTYGGDGVSCALAGCPFASGACCLPDGNCVQRSGSACRAAGGIYRGDGATCASNSCLGACCLIENEEVTCQSLPRSVCLFNSGEFQGVDRACSTVACQALVVGACCKEDNTCDHRTSTSCALQHGFYRGDNTMCETVPCPVLTGACCLPDGSCELIRRTECLDRGGLYSGHLTNCTTCPPPPPTGGCCLPDSRCVVVSEGNCATRNGDYFGDGSGCTPHPCDSLSNDLCADAAGPLALPSSVTGTTLNTEINDTSAGSCFGQIINSPGVWYTVVGTGNGLTASLCGDITDFDTKLSVYCRECVELVCVSANDDGCSAPFDGLQSEVSWCSEVGQVYHILVHGFSGAAGDFELSVRDNGAGCEATTRCRPVGACCGADLSCEEVTAEECSSTGGEFQGVDTFCPCPDPIGACCDRGRCVVTERSTCLATPGNVFRGADTDCSPNECPAPPNDLCGDAQVLSPLPMTVTGSTVQATVDGGLPACPPATVTTPGVWYRVTGTGTRMTATTCNTVGETFNHRISVFCGDCETPRCVASGDQEMPPCAFPTVEWCSQAGSTYFILVHGPNPFSHLFALTVSADLSSPCEPEVDCVIRGGCCMADGSCEVLQRTECDVAGGAYRGNDTTCEPNLCPQPEACCFPPQRCEDLLLAECKARGGSPRAGAVCNDIVCPVVTGACCVDADCQRLTEDACATAGGTFNGYETLCEPATCRFIVDSLPPPGSIDARQPSEPDGSQPAGLQMVTLTLNGPANVVSLADVAVSLTPLGPSVDVQSIMPNDNLLTVMLDSMMPPGHWLEITLLPSGSSVCFGYLPGDSDGSRDSGSADVTHLVGCLMNGGMSENCPLERTDMDRSSERNCLDVVRAVDILNGADSLESWHGAMLPASPCEP